MRTLILSSLLLLPIFAVAQDGPSMSPPKELDIFKPMIGTWGGKLEATFPGAPESVVDMKLVFSWDGQFMKNVASMDMGGMKMTETMYFGWNAEKSKYQSWAFTNWAPTPRIEWGVVEGNKSVWTCEPWDGGMGQKTVSRTTITVKDAKTVHFLLEFQMGDKFSPVMDGDITKVK